jgi:hypothetical protein
VKSAPNWLPHPTGQLPLGLAIVESPAIHTVIGAAAAAPFPVAVAPHVRAGLAAAASVAAATASGTVRVSAASQ